MAVDENNQLEKDGKHSQLNGWHSVHGWQHGKVKVPQNPEISPCAYIL